MSRQTDELKTREVLESWRRAAPSIDGVPPETVARALLVSLSKPLPGPPMPYSVLARAAARDSADPVLWIGALRALPTASRRSYEEAKTAELLSTRLRKKLRSVLSEEDPAWAALGPAPDEGPASAPEEELAPGPLLLGDPWSRNEGCLLSLPEARGPVRVRIAAADPSEGLELELEVLEGSERETRSELHTLETDTAFLAVGPPDEVRGLPDRPFGRPEALLRALSDADLVMTPTGVAIIGSASGAGGRYQIELRRQGLALHSARIRLQD